MLNAFPYILRRLDPEDAHNVLRYAIHKMEERAPWMLDALARRWEIPGELKKPVTWCDITFAHPVGMAAGFDKQADLVVLLQILDLAFAELGTFLPNFQEGNERPRIARVPGGLVNWMGFNSLGAEAARENLRKRLGRITMHIGGSLGKMATTPNEDAVDDYVRGMEILYDFVDYLVTNVSSPNTKDLRDLQRAEPLAKLIHEVNKNIERIARERRVKPLPFMVKLDPDMDDGYMLEAVGVSLENGARGIVVSNTSRKIAERLGFEKGGYSGELLADEGNRRTALIRQNFPNYFIVGSGGIMNGKRAVERMQAGANMIQLYNGLIQRGQPIIPECVKALHHAGY